MSIETHRAGSPSIRHSWACSEHLSACLTCCDVRKSSCFEAESAYVCLSYGLARTSLLHRPPPSWNDTWRLWIDLCSYGHVCHFSSLLASGRSSSRVLEYWEATRSALGWAGSSDSTSGCSQSPSCSTKIGDHNSVGSHDSCNFCAWCCGDSAGRRAKRASVCFLLSSWPAPHPVGDLMATMRHARTTS